MPLTVRKVNPLTMAEEIKALFMANERPEFPAWFDRAYPMAVREGASSWVLVHRDGQVVAHVGGFSTRLVAGGREAKGMLMVNLMADRHYRTFFPVLSVLKRAIQDMRDAGTDFIFTNPNNAGAVATMGAVGLKQVAALNRLLMPLGHANVAVGSALSAAHWIRRRALPRVRATLVSVSEASRWTTETACDVSRVTPRRSATLYGLRLAAFGTRLDMGIRLTIRDGTQVGAAIVRVPDEAEDPRLITLRCRTLGSVAGGAAAIGRLLRARGLRRLNGIAVMQSAFARELQRGGFIQRHDPCAIVAMGCTDLGRAAVAGLAAADLEAIDFD